MEHLVSDHQPRVLALLTRLLGDSHAASDAAQETWCAIWRARERLLPGVDPWPFIRTTAIRKAIDLRRTAKRAVASDETLDARSAPCPPSRRLELDLTALSEEERVSITLFFVDGCSIREIAAALDAPEGTVKSWLFRARAKLREHLTDDGSDRR